MDSRRTTLIWLLVAFAVFGVGALVTRFKSLPPTPAPSWQKAVSELTDGQQRVYRELRAQVRAAERERGATKSWPAPAGIFPDGWVQRRQGMYVNYLGERDGLRWLVLFIEPDPRAAYEKAPAEDDEHHTLSDGTALHVTVWTQALTEAATQRVTAFPAAEGWVERVAR